MKFQAGGKLTSGLVTSAACLVGMLLGASCGPASGLIGPTATPTTPITRPQAIALAGQNCQFFDQALVGQPSNVQAALVTAAAASKEIASAGYHSWMPPISDQVWRVNLDGRVAMVGGVLPTSGPGPVDTPSAIPGACAIFIDAGTGAVLGVRLTT